MVDQGSPGSSPLSRGIHMVKSQEEVRERIIPALAGNTAVRHASVWNPSDHPRSRGEYRDYPAWMSDTLGSSPLSRGIRIDQIIKSHRGRIIPALAGNTRPGGRRGGERQDHPRSRGEYRFHAHRSPMDRGSSPLSRGILLECSQCLGCGGIIPALAGNTTVARQHAVTPSDHPRSRGEYASISLLDKLQTGSSPLSRGIPACPR